MSYADGEAQILALLRGMDEFTPENTGRARWGLLNSGNAAQYAILRGGPFEVEQVALGMSERRWTTAIELYQRYRDDGTSATDLQDLTGAVVAHLEGYRDLDLAGVLVDAIRGGDMQEVWTRDGGPVWLKWEVLIVWTEEAANANG